MPSSTLALSRRLSFYEAMLARLLSKLPVGHLTLELQDGQVLYFGNGGGVKANIRVTDRAFFTKCIFYGDIGFAESYLDGDWHTDNIGHVITWFIQNLDHNPVLTGSGISRYAANLFRVANKVHHAGRKNTVLGSRRNISEHYDLGNDFYKIFLDASMTYSSAIFRRPDQTLESAQTEKYDRLCRNLKLKATDHVLEIGSGWGGFAIHAARNYGCRVTGITISAEQFKYAKEQVAKERLEDKIEIRLQDYRTLEGSFDKIVSIEMVEAVGHEFLSVFFEKCKSLLTPAGSLALQVITSRDRRYRKFRKDVDFIQKHIFPGSQTPSLEILHKTVNRVTDFNLFDVKDIGLDYARTLHLWHESFNQKLDEVKRLGMDEYFIRKWNYYLQYCEAAFQARHITVLQLVYARPQSDL
jgi:cyclopropane-fatty-acyl-phospholipid synthase